MTIREFETIAKAMAEVVFFDNDEKKVFMDYCNGIHNDDLESDGEYAYENLCNNLFNAKKGWEEKTCDDDILKFIGNRIFDAIINVKEAESASYGG